MSQKPEKKRIGLGKGLGALLDDSALYRNPNSSVNSGEVYQANELLEEVPIDFIETNPFQPREFFDQTALEELAESIKVHGIIQPITVRKISNRKYQLISGERRLQASKIAKLKNVPAFIRTADDQQMIEMALIENIQRENLNAIEIAFSYKLLMKECNLKQEELSERVGKNRSTVTNYLRLLKLPDEVQIAIRNNQISMGHARCLVGIENPDKLMQLFHSTIKESWSVRQLENASKQNPNHKKTNNPINKPSGEIKKYLTNLKEIIPQPLSLKMNEKGIGEIKISFRSHEELNNLIKILKK